MPTSNLCMSESQVVCTMGIHALCSSIRDAFEKVFVWEEGELAKSQILITTE